MIKKEELVNIVVVIFFIVGFLLLIDAQSVTGFTVKDLNDIEYLSEDETIDVIVTLKEKSTYSDKDNIKTQQDKFVKLNDLSLISDYDIINSLTIGVDKSDIKKILKDPNVKRVAFNHKFKISLDASKSQIIADKVWDKLVDGINLTGSGSVCVLDTGVDYSHGNLEGRVILGYDFVNNDSDPMDDNGHGTHVSGIITSDDSVYRGISFGGSVVAVKVMNSGGGGLYGDILNGIEWCINHKEEYNISVISMSIGTDGFTFSDPCDSVFPEFADLFNSAVANGIIVVASAGNEGKSDSLTSPGCVRNATSVGAVDDGNNIASFSNSASFLDLLAPGVGITSTKNGGDFVTHSGTSMAAPHVSAAVLLIKQYSNLDVFSLYDVLVNTGDDVLDSRNGYTFPRLNVFNALLSLDSFEPVLSFDIQDVYDDKNQSLMAGAEDTFLDSIWVEVDGVNYSNAHVMSGFDIGDIINYTFYANDSAGNLASNSSSFVVLDGSPVLEDIERLKAQVNKIFSYQVTASDPTNDDLVYSDDTELFDIDNTGLISFIPQNIGNYSVNISVSDSKHLIKDEFVLEVWLNNSIPEIVSFIPVNLSLSLDENESLEFSVVAEDLDNTSLSYDWYLDGNSVSGENYNFVTDYSSAGNYNITVVVSDGIDLDSLEWSVVVDNVDLVPLFVGLIENIGFNENTNYSLDLSSYFVDLDGDSLSYNMSHVENISFRDGVLIPDFGFVGNKEVSFFAYDPNMNSAESNLVSLTLVNVPVCGDGLLEGDEECDLSNLNSKGCLDFDYDSGSLGCDSECKFDYSGCMITSSSSGGSPSGGGGTPTGGDEGETQETVHVVKKTEQVKGEVKASDEEKPMEGTGEIVKEQEIKPKTSRIKTLFIKVGDFFKFIWYKISSLFR